MEKPATLENINKEEYKCFIEARKKYGEYFKLSEDLVVYSFDLIKTYNNDSFISYLMYAPIPKAMSLSILSIIRKHSYQTHLNIRIVLEYLMLVLYAFEKPDVFVFLNKSDIDDKYIHNDKVKYKAAKWLLTTKYVNKINEFKELRDAINDTHAHANINNAKFNIDIKNDTARIHFFDQVSDENTCAGIMGFNRMAINVFETIYLYSKEYNTMTFKETIVNDLKNFIIRFSKLGDKFYKRKDNSKT